MARKRGRKRGRVMLNQYKEEYFDSLKSLDERIKELKKKRYDGYKLSIYICKYDYYQGKHRLGYIWKKVRKNNDSENLL